MTTLDQPHPYRAPIGQIPTFRTLHNQLQKIYQSYQVGKKKRKKDNSRQFFFFSTQKKKHKRRCRHQKKCSPDQKKKLTYQTLEIAY